MGSSSPIQVQSLMTVHSQTSVPKSFWAVVYSQRAFFDVRICNPTAQSYLNSSLEAVYRSQERGKRRQYKECIREVEMSSFTPLVFSMFGGMSKSTAVAYKRLADLISVKQSEPYGQVIMISRIRIKINFALLKSSCNQCNQRIQISTRETSQT